MKPHATTSTINKDLIVIAHSARALVQSVKQLADNLIAVDGFADIDTQRACSTCWCVPLEGDHFEISKLSTCLYLLYQRHPQARVLLGPGGEFYSHFIEQHLPTWSVLGNTAQTINEISEANVFFNSLDQLDIPYPQISFTASAPNNGIWLCKTALSCGGVGVSRSKKPAKLTPGSYWQREIRGSSISALALSNGQDSKIIGFNQQLSFDAGGLQPYLYAGTIANIEVDEVITDKTIGYIDKLVEHFNIKGMFSVDMMLVDQGLYVLEVNPRISASYELYEQLIPDLNLVDAHIRVCEGDALCTLPTVQTLAGRQLMYANKTHLIKEVDWPEWTSDQPCEGEVITVGQPLCSVFAEGVSLDAVQDLLLERLQHVSRLI